MQHFFQISFSNLGTLDLVFLVTFSVLLLVRIFYLCLFAGPVAFKKRRNDNLQAGEPISLLLTFRNEEKNLLQNLPKLLKIDNAEFEVIAVDDFSQDNSLSVLGILKNENKKLHVSSLNQETRFSEKLAQNIAMKAAKYNWVMVIPASLAEYDENWLATISGKLTQDKEVIINYSNVLESKGLYNQLYRAELFLRQLRSAGFTAFGLPLTYTEENVAFRKKKYFDGTGYGQKLKEPYANLELLINFFIRKNKTEVFFEQKTAIRKNEKIERQDYFDLLIKGFRIENLLPAYKRYFLYLEEWTRLLLLPLFVAVIIFVSEFWLFVLIAILFKTILHLFIIKRVINHLNERKIFISSFMYELIMPYYKAFYRWHFNRRSRKQQWRSNS